jgi:diguanylate cyclase (GGDEF)-like protein
VLVSLLAVTAALAGSWQLHNAERRLLGERGKIVAAIASYRSRNDDPRVLTGLANSVGFTPANAAANDALLAAFDITPDQDPSIVVGLFDTSSRALAVRPHGAVLDPTALGPVWQAAKRGTPGWSLVFRYRGRAVRAELVPVATGGGVPWGVLVQVGADLDGDRFNQALGALGPGTDTGGMSEVDRAGVAVSSWSRALVGTRVVDPARLPVPGARLTREQQYRGVNWIETGPGGQETPVIASPVPTTGYAIIFAVPARELYSQLRKQQARRDRILIAVVAACGVGLVAFGALREIAVRRSRTRLSELLANTHDLIALVLADGTVAFVSSSVRRLLGQPESAWLGQPLPSLVHPEDRDRVERLLTRAAEPGSGEVTVTDIRLRAGADDPQLAGGGEGAGDAGATPPGHRWFDLTALDSPDDAELGGVLVTCHEIGQRKQLQDRLGHQARHDPLTGLPNRATFLARLDGTLATSAAVGTRDAVLFIDLDGFKPVNDQLGHAAGDEVLRIVARRVVAALRPGDLACRFGGDEFGALLRDIGPEDALAVADRLVASIGSPVMLEPVADRQPPGARRRGGSAGREVRVGASVGVVVSDPSPGGGSDVHALLRAADQAMYAAKRDRAGPRTVLAPEPAPAVAGGRKYPGEAPDRLAGRRWVVAGEGDGRPAVSDGAARLARPGVRGVPRRRWRRRLRALAPVLAVATGLLVVVGIGLWDDMQGRAADRADTINTQRALISALNSSASALVDPARLSVLVSAAPWTFTNPAADSAVLAALSRSALVGPGARLLLVGTDARVLTARPAGARLGVILTGPTWRAAVAGRSGWTRVLMAGGAPSVPTLEPIVRGGKVVAVLVIERSSRDSVFSQLLGSLSQAGEIDAVDRFGRGGFVSDLRNAGRVLVDPNALARLVPGEVEHVPSTNRGLYAFATPVLTVPRYFLVLRRRPQDIFNDIGSSLPGVALLLTIVGLTLAAIAITDDRRHRALRREADRFDALLRGAHDIVAAVGPDGRVTVVGPSIIRLLGLRVSEWAGHDLAELVHPEDAERLSEFVRRPPFGPPRAPEPAGGRREGNGWTRGANGRAAPRPTATLTDVRLRAVDGRHRWFDLTASAPAPSCALSGLLLTCHEIGERKLLQDELTAAAHRDPLTGLPNRAAFNRGIEEAAARAQAGGPAAAAAGPGGWAQTRGWAGARTGPGAVGPRQPRFGVLFVDLDHFKPINDTYGHHIGDELLEVVALRLDAAVRVGDVVARYGGDEFAVLVEDTDPAQLAELGERIVEALSRPVATAAAVVTVSATVGAAVGTPDPDRTVRAADAAMYKAKRLGRGRVVVAPTLDEIRLL